MAAVNRMQKSTPEEAASALSGVSQTFEETVSEYPLSTVLACFGVGIGCGALIGLALTRDSRSHTEQTAARIGKRVLASISDYLPESLRR